MKQLPRLSSCARVARHCATGKKMKLKCELRPLRNGGHSLGFNDGDREHDAAAAHALMVAIGEFYDAPLDSTLTTPEDAINWLEWRASELMREWGFDSGEDA